MNIGQMDRQIALQRFASSRNEYGEEVGAWQDVAAKVWAEKKFRSGAETYDADQKQAVQKVDFRIRWKPGITSQLRVVELATADVYHIDSVSEIGRKQGLLLTSYQRGEPVELPSPDPSTYSALYTTSY